MRAGRLDEAFALQRVAGRLRDAFGLGTFPAVVKEAMSLIGEPVGRARLPVGPLAEDARARLGEVLDEAGRVERGLRDA